MLNLGHPHQYQGLLKAKFEKAAKRKKNNEPRVFKYSNDFANHIVRACNSGVLLHLVVAETLGLGANTKLIHKTLRSLKDSQINGYMQKIIDAHKRDDWNYFELTQQDRPEPPVERKIIPIKLNAK